jgi:hypothetical protein
MATGLGLATFLVPFDFSRIYATAAVSRRRRRHVVALLPHIRVGRPKGTTS